MAIGDFRIAAASGTHFRRMDVPKRQSLATQVAEILRRELSRRACVEFLPGERALCEQFRVSRMTLRAALDVLQREGRINSSQGRRRRVTARAQSAAKSGAPRTVGVLGTVDFHTLHPFTLFLINHLQAHLTDAGCKLEVHVHPRFASQQYAKELDELMGQTHVDCWVIAGHYESLNRWFGERRLRAVAVASLSKDAYVPCLGVDYSAICRHAVGVLRARGHSRMALVLSRTLSQLEKPLVDVFLESAPATQESHEAQRQIAYHNGHTDGIASTLRSLFRSPMAPTGLLVARPKHVLTVMSRLMNSGRRVPRDVSLISLGYEPYLAEMLPSVAHYDFNWDVFARRLFRVVMQLLDTGVVAPHETRLMAKFHDGATLACRG